jgi:hypothetical protein
MAGAKFIAKLIIKNGIIFKYFSCVNTCGISKF